MEKKEITSPREFREGTPLPEFGKEVPTRADIEKIAGDVAQNRDQWRTRADEFGINLNFLMRQGPIIVSPFVYPSPISTTYAGSPERFKKAVEIGKNITDALQQKKVEATQRGAVYLAMSPMLFKGVDAQDALIVPQNASENKRVFLAKKASHGTAYAAVTTDRSTLESQQKTLTDSFNVYRARNQQLSRYDGLQMIGQITSDVRAAIGEGTEEMRYIDYAMRLNQMMGTRVTPSYQLTDTCIDTEVYDPFMREGIANPGKFFSQLVDAGLPTEEVSSVKVVDDKGYTRFLHVSDFDRSDALLRFRDTGENIRYTDLQRLDVSLAPSKELSYPMCFSNMVPVVYGSQNSGGYYAPYAQSRRVVEKLGFSPTLYRIQDNYDGDYTTMPTVFDFYKTL